MASACQHDSDAKFDDAGLTPPDSGGSSSEAGAGTGGADASGGSSAGGAKGGSANAGGKTGSAGMGGAAEGGKAGSHGGTETNGGAAGTTHGGNGGKNAAGSGGTANPDPEPVTVEIIDTDDAHVASCYPNTNFGEAKTVNVDHDQCTYQGLMNPSLADIPDGAVVSEATLTLTCINPGDTVNVSYVAGTWSELSVDWNGRPEAGLPLGSIDCADVGQVTFDLTVAVKAWLSGAHAKHGVYLRTEGSDGTDFASSEATDESERPTLSVTYTLPLK